MANQSVRIQQLEGEVRYALTYWRLSLLSQTYLRASRGLLEWIKFCWCWGERELAKVDEGSSWGGSSLRRGGFWGSLDTSDSVRGEESGRWGPVRYEFLERLSTLEGNGFGSRFHSQRLSHTLWHLLLIANIVKGHLSAVEKFKTLSDRRRRIVALSTPLGSWIDVTWWPGSSREVTALIVRWETTYLWNFSHLGA